MENFANAAVTTLASAINDSQTSFDVTDASMYPSPNFRIKIDSEIMLVTGVSTNTLTVTRGVEGTTASSHLADARVTHPLTSGALSQAITENIQVGMSGGVSVPRNGMIYATTDLGTLHLNGAVFGQLARVIVPPTSGWSWIDQLTANVNQNSLGELLSYTGSTSNYRSRVRNISVSVAGDFRVTMGFYFNALPLGDSRVCIFLRNSSTDKFALVALAPASAAYQFSRGTVSGGSWSYAQTISFPKAHTTAVVYLRLEYYASNLTRPFCSVDGVHWSRVTTGFSGLANFFDGVPDQIGFGIRSTSTAGAVHAQLFHYLEEAF